MVKCLDKISYEHSWADIVLKTVDSKLHKVQIERTQIQKTVKDTKDDMTEEIDMESRKNNVIIYNMKESNTDALTDRFKDNLAIESP